MVSYNLAFRRDCMYFAFDLCLTGALKYTPLSWEETQTRWRGIAWLSLGIGNRADWIANALVVIPSAFLFSGAVDYRRKSRWSLSTKRSTHFVERSFL